MNEQLTTRQAVLHVLSNNIVVSKYALAKALGIQPIMIANYLNNGTRMGINTAAKFETLYSITVTDVYNNRSNINEAMATPDSDS